MRDECWYCGGKLIWDNDYDWDDVYGDGGQGIVTYLHCSKCGANVEYSFNEADSKYERVEEKDEK